MQFSSNLLPSFLRENQNVVENTLENLIFEKKLPLKKPLKSDIVHFYSICDENDTFMQKNNLILKNTFDMMLDVYQILPVINQPTKIFVCWFKNPLLW